MGRAAVDLGVDGDGRDPELAQSAKDANRDLPAVGDQDFRELSHSPLVAGAFAVAFAFSVEILGDACCAPAARVGGRRPVRREEALERERHGLTFLGIRLGTADELHPSDTKGP